MPNTILLLLIILLESFVALSLATDSPAAAPTSGNEISGESLPRKLGKLHHQAASPAPIYSPIAEPEAEKKAEETKEGLLKKHHHHHGVDKSVAGGGVILGGLATTFLVAVFCYIRATARHKSDLGTNTTEA